MKQRRNGAWAAIGLMCTALWMFFAVIDQAEARAGRGAVPSVPGDRIHPRRPGRHFLRHLPGRRPRRLLLWLHPGSSNGRVWPLRAAFGLR